METLSGSPCQLGLEVVLRYHGPSSYTRTQFLYWHHSSQSLANLSSYLPWYLDDTTQDYYNIARP